LLALTGSTRFFVGIDCGGALVALIRSERLVRSFGQWNNLARYIRGCSFRGNSFLGINITNVTGITGITSLTALSQVSSCIIVGFEL
jgi:hypothetical protein